MKDSDIIAWLNESTGGQLQSFKDASTGREICFVLADLAEDRKSKKMVSMGKTPEEKAANFEIASRIYEQLGLTFNYDINLLVQGDKNEIRNLIQEIISLSNDPSEDIDGLLQTLENDLKEKLEEAKTQSKQLEDVALERDFYFEKLRKIEAVARRYPPDVNDSIIKIISLKAPEILPE
ncbi:hypothetical protein TVAG_157820 [Trichomonas vaginalis G3]|uniref:EB1 C-terminal domain-containing protein n=1 Tax=Trichomonas vaginalis (strain ATCC PRA-98 / G3) TaxID=412133 RepID=A2FBB7_TRIV3|nr:hypothetical protein TVAGG3_0232250 [Trichomonas vaginalis G3]EAX97797.1 hypothetical protein TVAG_157820 [Trichomonas vaginalis G3]KAI5552727.1 hypothetical protein TVAGG3_0232250 [Trichomonas vaginalis G3]|eukprot:XP_001310727.1 hypothetical protein [Trichomonas vaginalis G3]